MHCPKTINVATLVLLLSFSLQAQTLVVGILGGWQKYDAPHRAVRQLALRIDTNHFPGVSVETFENHHRKLALQRIREWHASLGAGGRIIIYGQSFGGASAVHLDRELDKLGIPVALSVHVDSVGKNDRLIPSNVAAAANFFQREAWSIRGQTQIQAQDPSRTLIIGNVEYHYRGKPIDESDESWASRVFFGTHLKMEKDPAVWDAVEMLIMQYLSPLDRL